MKSGTPYIHDEAHTSGRKKEAVGFQVRIKCLGYTKYVPYGRRAGRPRQHALNLAKYFRDFAIRRAIAASGPNLPSPQMDRLRRALGA